MRHDEPSTSDTDATERMLRRALPALALLALIALAAATVRPAADPAPAGTASEPETLPAMAALPVPDGAPLIDHSVVERLALPEESVIAGASVAAYER